jgi:hypothetical protein
MPFVSDIVGPQRPVQAPATLVTGSLRRTSTIDTHPARRALGAIARLPGGRRLPLVSVDTSTRTITSVKALLDLRAGL